VRLPAQLSVADLAVPAVVGTIATFEVLSVRPPAGLTVLAVLWGCLLLLVFRRRWPLPIATLAGLALALPFLGTSIQDLTSPALVIWVAGYAAGRWLPDLRGLPVVALYLAIMAAGLAERGPTSTSDLWGNVVWGTALIVPPYVVGVLVRRWTTRTHRLAEETQRLTAAQEQIRRETAAAERARIARELHDVLAHSVSAMVVQATAAEDLIRADPDRAVQVLHEVSEVGRRALAETGRLLHRIRDTDNELGLAPDAGLDRLGELVDGFRKQGLTVELETDGAMQGLPAGLDLSAYRIVQEALTNALRHGGGGVSVRVARRPDEVAITVRNPAGHGGTSGSGLGLRGMSERVAVFGGSLRHGRQDGHYELAVRLPLAESAA
jgi:signal transduction histidine kinase